MHKVTPVTEGERYSITLYTPGKLDRLTAQDWDNLAKAGFPIYLYEPLPAKMRRYIMSVKPESGRINQALAPKRAAQSEARHRSHDALVIVILLKMTNICGTTFHCQVSQIQVMRIFCDPKISWSVVGVPKSFWMSMTSMMGMTKGLCTSRESLVIGLECYPTFSHCMLQQRRMTVSGIFGP